MPEHNFNRSWVDSLFLDVVILTLVLTLLFTATTAPLVTRLRSIVSDLR